MTRKRWLIAAALLLTVFLCLAVAAAGAVWVVKNIPAAARLVYRDSSAVTPSPTRYTRFDTLSISTLTPTAAPVEPTATFTPQRTDLGPEPEMTVKSPKVTRTSTAAPSAIATAAPPSPSPAPSTPTPTPVQLAPAPQLEWLTFETDRGRFGDYEIFVMTTEGAHVTNLTDSWADDVSPVWSRDGQRIAFVSWRDTLTGKWSLESGSIYIMDFDPATGTARNLFRLTNGEGNDTWPTWSPDGKRIAFQSDRDGNLDIWVINVDGSGLTNLTKSPREDEHPAWSPDGTKIAFTSRREGNRDIWVMNANGSNPENLTREPGRDRYAMWSPDGTKIAFNTNRDGNQEIYVMNADGSAQRNVTNSPSIEGLADWSPDGTRLVLYSNRPGDKDIFILDLKTGQWINVNRSPDSEDEFCTWSP